jgi:hypothetical protein
VPVDWLGDVRCRGGVTLFQALLGNVGTGRGDAKGEAQVGNTTRVRVPMRRTGAEQPVVVKKRSNVRGAKGLRHSVLAVGQPAKGGTYGRDKAGCTWLNDGSRMSGDVQVRF